MTVIAGQAVTTDFVTNDATGALTDAAPLPGGTLVRNGTDTGETVTVTNKATGRYKAATTIPAGYSVGDEVEIYIAATVGGTASGGVVWKATLGETMRGTDNAATAAALTQHDTDIKADLATIEARLMIVGAANGGGGQTYYPGSAFEAIDIEANVFDSGPLMLLARVLGWDTNPIVQSDISEIEYSVFLLDDQNSDTRTAVTAHSAVSLQKNLVLFDTLQTDARWTLDSTGYNFRHLLNVHSNPAFAIAGRRYLVEVKFTPATISSSSGESGNFDQTIIARWRVNVK